MRYFKRFSHERESQKRMADKGSVAAGETCICKVEISLQVSVLGGGGVERPGRSGLGAPDTAGLGSGKGRGGEPGTEAALLGQSAFCLRGGQWHRTPAAVAG